MQPSISEILTRHVFGCALAEDPNLLVQDGWTTTTRKRSWRERLFRRPWRPWVATQEYRQPHMVPDPHYYIITPPFGCKRLLAHPTTMQALIAKTAASGNHG